MKEKSVVREKSMAFAIRTIKLNKYLCNEKNEYVMSKQLLRSGTSVGANIREAEYGQSRNDFIAKMSIALKEISETNYWLELLFKTEYLNKEEYESICKDSEEIAKLLTSIVKTTKLNRE